MSTEIVENLQKFLEQAEELVNENFRLRNDYHTATLWKESLTKEKSKVERELAKANADLNSIKHIINNLNQHIPDGTALEMVESLIKGICKDEED